MGPPWRACSGAIRDELQRRAPRRAAIAGDRGSKPWPVKLILPSSPRARRATPVVPLIALDHTRQRSMRSSTDEPSVRLAACPRHRKASTLDERPLSSRPFCADLSAALFIAPLPGLSLRDHPRRSSITCAYDRDGPIPPAPLILRLEPIGRPPSSLCRRAANAASGSAVGGRTRLSSSADRRAGTAARPPPQPARDRWSRSAARAGTGARPANRRHPGSAHGARPRRPDAQRQGDAAAPGRRGSDGPVTAGTAGTHHG